ncbi:hypothetical protein [Sphingomonas sp. LT1P40]|uniref:hypothetical protein n=1 Tax=Alteristakelama amylovorans TaxID=3096166 RepID=UPI002FC605E6
MTTILMAPSGTSGRGFFITAALFCTAMLGACDTYTPPIIATIESIGGDRSNIAIDRVRYRVGVRMDRKYRAILTTDGTPVYLSLSDCRTKTHIAGPVPAEIPKDDAGPIIATFDLRPPNGWHLCVTLSGGSWRTRIRSRATPLTTIMIPHNLR